MNEYFKIGKIVSTFGLQGELLIKHSLNTTALSGLNALFIEQTADVFLPYFISGIRSKNNDEFYIQLEEVKDKETARKYLQKEVWVTASDFKKYADKSAPISLLGYQLVDGKNTLGTITEVIEQPHQILCTIEIKGKEAYIPLNESTLQNIQHKSKKVLVKLPAGLLDIYL